MTRAQLLIDIGRHAEALKMLHGLAAEEPANTAVLCRIAVAELGLKHHREALHAADAAIAAAPDQEWGHRLRSIALDRMKRKKEALASALTARSLSPEEPVVLYHLFWMLHNAKRKAEADEALRELLRVAPDSWYAHYAAGSSEMAKKNLVTAEQHFRDALRINPTSWEAQNNLGVALLRQGKRDESVEAFWSAAKNQPDSNLVRHNIRRAAMRKVTFAGVFLYLAIQLARFAGDSLGGEWAVATLIILAIAGWGIWRFTLRWGLRPEIARFVREERRRETMRNLRVLGGIFTAAVAAIWGLLMLGDRTFRPASISGWVAFAVLAVAGAWLMTRVVRMAE